MASTPPSLVGAPAPGANVCPPRSHRGRCSYDKPPTTPYRRSTRLGCECVPARFAPGAVLLQMNLPPPRIVGAPASGANACRTGSHRGGARTRSLPLTPIVGAPAPGAYVCLPGSHRGGDPTTSLPPPRIVGAPVPGANVCLPRSHRGGAPTNTPASTPYRRSTRTGCEYVLDRFAPGA